jgi:hypothetical protein
MRLLRRSVALSAARDPEVAGGSVGARPAAILPVECYCSESIWQLRVDCRHFGSRTCPPLENHPTWVPSLDGPVNVTCRFWQQAVDLVRAEGDLRRERSKVVQGGDPLSHEARPETRSLEKRARNPLSPFAASTFWSGFHEFSWAAGPWALSRKSPRRPALSVRG